MPHTGLELGHSGIFGHMANTHYVPIWDNQSKKRIVSPITFSCQVLQINTTKHGLARVPQSPVGSLRHMGLLLGAGSIRQVEYDHIRIVG